ncbi:MAG: DUF5343 domain-containing protein [Calditrichaeota bacterium]|nr:DUF5343 domain-containing protein [Calditrichota bacterium]
MALPNSYTLKTGAIHSYFDAILGAEAPARFSIKFLENLEFTSSGDRLIIGVLKELGFLNTDGEPQQRYHDYLDKSRSNIVLAEGIKEAYVDLFAVNKEAHKLDIDGVFNKLRTLYKGEKKDTVIKNIARTFVALCEVADFTKTKTPPKQRDKTGKTFDSTIKDEHKTGTDNLLSLASLQYHINIVLPDTRDQAVYDAIFKSLRDHLG